MNKNPELNSTFNFSLFTSKKGMTLVETMVSVVILTFTLGAIFTILNLQTVKSAQVQKTSLLQTDAQVALTLLKWDFASAGLAFPKTDSAVRSINGGLAGTDAINLKAVGLGFESGRIKWSWLLNAVNSNIIEVRSWADTLFNFKVGDTVVVLMIDRRIMSPGDLVISNIDTFTHVDNWGNSVRASRLTLDNPVNSTKGLVVIGKHSEFYSPGITISVSNNKLVRGSDTLLDNVEELQFSYGIDNDGDGVIETWTDNIPQFATFQKKWGIRYTLVVTSRPMGGYTYPRDSMYIEDHAYALTAADKRMKRAIFTGVISPPNLQP
ncbi:PilW family protein [candidate division WOR-3 bacterium]|nr:PilW family protein [candidate division WOR-3 bacterium]